MLYYDRIDLGERIDLTENKNNKECIVYHYWFFNHGFKFQKSVCDGCQDLLMLCLNISDITVITVTGIIVVLFIIHLLENSALDDRSQWNGIGNKTCYIPFNIEILFLQKIC